MPKEKRVTLEDLMMAMDVVDTLRHHEMLVDRELNAEQRREKMIERLREIYASQGIEVSDAMLEEGVKALEEERFAFVPPKKGFNQWTAKLYISRDKWLKPLAGTLFAILVGGGLYYFLSVKPQQEARQALPVAIAQQYETILKHTDDTKARARAQTLESQAKRALQKGEIEIASQKLNALKVLQESLTHQYRIRIVQEPSSPSGIWRRPPGNPAAKNYYLIVEGIDATGAKVAARIHNEEDDTIRKVTRWGVRVSRSVFERVAQDKRDDGIIQHRDIGIKRSGRLAPEYTIPTTGATITKW